MCLVPLKFMALLVLSGKSLGALVTQCQEWILCSDGLRSFKYREMWVKLSSFLYEHFFPFDIFTYRDRIIEL